jgi:hypothetical protein
MFIAVARCWKLGAAQRRALIVERFLVQVGRSTEERKRSCCRYLVNIGLTKKQPT